MDSIVHDYTTKAGRKVVVIDNAIPTEIGNDLYEYMQYFGRWNFNPDEDEDSDMVPFIHGFDNDLIHHSPLWSLLKKPLIQHFGEGFVPYDCSVNHLRFGDNPIDHRDTHDPKKKDVTLLLYLNPSWNLNFAGETVYFDEQGEIELAVLPKFRRLAMHEGYINHAARAPSRLFKGARYTLAIKATPDMAYLKTRTHEDEPEDKDMIDRRAVLAKNLFGDTQEQTAVVSPRSYA
ncbi:MAG TPA: hypothetical protein EYP59_13065 [Thiotrichaceae bacterium]|nr:hypothetical protein [Thiotrichaceae bacterium]